MRITCFLGLRAYEFAKVSVVVPLALLLLPLQNDQRESPAERKGGSPKRGVQERFTNSSYVSATASVMLPIPAERHGTGFPEGMECAKFNRSFFPRHSQQPSHASALSQEAKPHK
jgi:hypothetical protein